MNTWDCCRTCLSKDSLSPIFPSAKHGDSYSEVILTTTGLKIQKNDSLPQKMCTMCADTINKCFRFREKCHETEITLMQRLKQKQFHCVKESSIKTDKDPSCTNKTKEEDGFDNDTELDYGLNSIPTPKDKTANDYLIFESTVDDILKKEVKIEFELVKPSEKVKLKKITKQKCNKTTEVKIESYDEFDYGIEDDIPLNKVFEETVTENKSENVLKPYECEFCRKIYKSKFSYFSHKKIHTGRKIICEHCGKQFLDRRRLLMHCKAKHGYLKTDKCRYCDYTGISVESVKIHERLHTGEKPYVCEVCSASFHRRSSYLQHGPIHLPDKTVPCDLCPLLFKSTTLMRIHRSRHKPREFKHRCLVCGGSFSKRWHCLRHLIRIHGVRNATSEHLERVRINAGD